MSVIVGIDPGVTGAVAVIDSVYWTNCDVTDLDAMSYMPKGFVKRRIDSQALAKQLQYIRDNQGHIDHIVIEAVHAGSTQGVSSNFSLGLSLGIIVGCVDSFCVGKATQMHLVPPHVWKKGLSLERGKDIARQRAIRQWPHMAERLARAKDHNRAEALLIAYYGALIASLAQR